jgi:AraC-like DNA-binding protein
MDPFAALFAHSAPAARTFFSGTLCRAVQFEGSGHLHLLRQGSLTLTQPDAAALIVTEPSLLFFPRDRPHGFQLQAEAGADLVCATIDLGHAGGNPIGQGLPEFVLLPLAQTLSLEPVCALLVAEAFDEAGGREVALDRLFEYLLILIIRSVVARGEVTQGVLAGLADPRLTRALTAMHEHPAKPWTVEALAERAGMSRTRFASHFRSIVGQTPLDHLTGWRMTLARQQLTAGKPVKSVAAAVGYDSPAAFSRVFTRLIGRPPRAFATQPTYTGQSITKVNRNLKAT